MSDKLIFDMLLASAGIPQPDTYFPPTDVDSLRRLLDAIRDSGYDTLKKDCLVYWLLKWHQDGRSKTFREMRGIPPQFVTLADAFWLLDTAINVEVRSHSQPIPSPTLKHLFFFFREQSQCSQTYA
jgi:hypothetical protein